ncbi:MAG: CIA30 family protein [Synechococcales bacterium]|nr:CIA30 family protein [Synechococcales bacterium]
MSQQPSTQWDLCRFVKTLAYFGAVPLLSGIGWFQQLFGSEPNPRASQTAIAYRPQTHEASTDPPVLITGSMGDLSKHLMQELLQRGYGVRSLVQNPADIASFLGKENPAFEFHVADLARPDSLLPRVMQNTRAVIHVADLGANHPETDAEFVASLDLRLGNLVRAIAPQGQSATATTPPSQMIFDFRQPTTDLEDVWGAVDDVVMGGVSQSSLQFTGSTALFAGTVSTANSGGFASVRTRNFEPALNLSNFEGIELRVKGDGKRYKFLLRDESRWDGVGYSHSFDTMADTWITVRVPFADLIPVFRARTLENAQQVDASRIRAFQLMLSKFEYDGGLNPTFEPGEFRLEVEFIAAYRAAAAHVILIAPPEAVEQTGAIAQLQQNSIACTVIPCDLPWNQLVEKCLGAIAPR